MAHRDEMLEMIRRALGRSRTAAGSEARTSAALPAARIPGVMPAIAEAELLAKFEDELQKLTGSTYRAATPSELDQILRTILATAKATSVVLSRNPLLAELKLPERLRVWGHEAVQWPETPGAEPGSNQAYRQFADRSFAAAVGITGVDFALAETGSLVLSSRTEGSQLASLAPPVHVALYRRAQVLGSLDDVLERLALSGDLNSPAPGRSVVIVTGPSRTADIEQVLIRGVHGPREVHAILVEEACFVH